LIIFIDYGVVRRTLDTTDYRLLELLQQDAQLPVSQLADRVNMSAPACYKRIQRLRDQRLIQREIAVVAPSTMGWPISMLVLVTLEREKKESLQDFVNYIANIPQIIEAWYVTGDYDVVLRVVASSMEEFETMTRESLYSRKDIRVFKTLVTMRTMKQMSPIMRSPIVP
jgi:Lrp/AsnC family transcriptional regulator, leucine-responsive regulatory protein